MGTYSLTGKAVVGLNLVFSETNKVDNTTQYGASSFVGWVGNIAKGEILDSTSLHDLEPGSRVSTPAA